MWWGSGTRGSALASWPDWQLPLLSWTSLQLSKPSSPRKRKPLLLPSNDAPCCIATKMRVPRLFSPPHDVGPLPTLARRACRLRSGPACNGCHLPFSMLLPGVGLRSHSPGSRYRCPSRATSLKRASKPAPQLRGVGLLSAHAQGGWRGAEGPAGLQARARSRERMRPTPRSCLFPSNPAARDWGRKFELGTEVCQERGKK